MNGSFAKLGPLVLRIVVGLVFVLHGWQKIAGPKHQPHRIVENLRHVASGMESIGVPQPAAAAWIVAAVELFGGALLVAGVVTRLWALLLTAIMAVATFRVHLPQGFFQKVTTTGVGGYEFQLVLLGACVSLLCTGGGLLEVFPFPRGKKKEAGGSGDGGGAKK